MSDYRIITINLMPAKHGIDALNFLKEVQEYTNQFITISQFHPVFDERKIHLSWYSDAPASEGISVSVNFSVLEGVDFVKQLVISYRKQSYQIIGIIVGY